MKNNLLLLFLFSLIIHGCVHENELVPAIPLDISVDINPNVPKTVRLNVQWKGADEFFIEYWPVDNYAYAKTISVQPLSSGLYAISIHQLIEHTIYNYAIKTSVDSVDIDHQLREFKTASRPKAVDEFYNESENEINAIQTGHLLLHRSGHPSVILILDNKGQVTWYRTSANMIKVAKLTHRNTILTLESSSDQPFADADLILETNFNGDTLLHLKYGQNEFDQIPHHDLLLNNKNNVVFLTNFNKGEFIGDGILELDRKGQRVWEWNTFSFFENPDPSTYMQPWANSLVEKEGYYYVSFRQLSQVWKIHKNNKQTVWKLGEGGDFDLSADSKFMNQHFVHFNDNAEILMFDNGDIDSRGYSRVLSLDLTKSDQSILPQINIQLPQEYFSPYMGSVQQLTNNEFLVCSAVNGVILNMSSSGELNWKLKTKDRIYRCVYIENVF